MALPHLINAPCVASFTFSGSVRFARNRIATHLTAARTALAEATSMLRSGAKSTDLDEQRVLAARKRSPQTVSAARPILPTSGRIPRTGAAEPGTKAPTRRPP
jgi:hypothetical protein